MRTTLDLPEDLLNEAMEASNAKTKTSVIVIALTELVRQSKIADLKEYRGKIDLPINMDEVRGR